MGAPLRSLFLARVVEKSSVPLFLVLYGQLDEVSYEEAVDVELSQHSILTLYVIVSNNNNRYTR